MRSRWSWAPAMACGFCLALVGCGDSAATESPGSSAPSTSATGEGLLWPSEGYYAGWFERGGQMVFRYFSDHEQSAIRELQAHGYEGLPSRYSSAEWDQMMQAIFEAELSSDEYFGTGYNGADDVFEVVGQVDEAKMANVLDGHVYRYVPATGGRGH